jgi:polyketide synthase 12
MIKPDKRGTGAPTRSATGTNSLNTTRRMLAKQDKDHLTTDAPAEQAALGKDTAFHHFDTRARTFQSPLDDDERTFQEQVLSSPPPLGAGTAPLNRLIAYGRARAGFLVEHRDIARAALDGSQPVPIGRRTPMSQVHIRMLLGQLDLAGADLDMLAIQLTGALDGPVLLYLSSDEHTDGVDEVGSRIGHAWQDLMERTCRP